MTDRKTLYKIGVKGEERIADKLRLIPGVTVSQTGKKHPDLFLTIGKTAFPLTFAIECKTVLGVHKGGRMGDVTLSQTEIEAMNELTDSIYTPLLIVEIRSKNGLHKSYFIVPWRHIKERYEAGSPRSMSLGFWWIISYGYSLDIWIHLHLGKWPEIIAGVAP